MGILRRLFRRDPTHDEVKAFRRGQLSRARAGEHYVSTLGARSKMEQAINAHRAQDRRR